MSDLLDSTVKKTTVQDGFCNMQDRIRHIFIDGLIVLIVSALIQAVIEEAFIFHSGNSYDFKTRTMRIKKKNVVYVNQI